MKQILAAVFLLLFASILNFAQASDAELRSVIQKDQSSREEYGKLPTLTAAEHLARGKTYFDNRQFPQSREHFQKIIENFPAESAISSALFMTGRSYYWEREYLKAIPFLERSTKEYPSTKDGREGLYFNGSCNVRLGRNIEAAKLYEQYSAMFPTGERIEGALLNIVDALREAGKYDEANGWVDKTTARFTGTPTETNALHARLRMDIYRGNWKSAVETADSMLARTKFFDSMASSDEVKFLRAFAIEKSGTKQDAMDAYAEIPNSYSSYYGGLASERLAKNGAKFRVPSPLTAKQISDSPVMFRLEILEFSRKHKIDPRFVLAIMKQESSFRPAVKSPSAARGLLQLVIDTALKYNKKAGFPVLQPDDLYVPRINIAIGTEYIADLKNEFGGLYEAIAASYNGGEDNAARWLNRSKPKEPGIFASEVGFAETKHYVFKVMTNFRIYRELYDEKLVRK